MSITRKYAGSKNILYTTNLCTYFLVVSLDVSYRTVSHYTLTKTMQLFKYFA